MSIKSQLEALIYAAEDPITLDQMASLLQDDLLALKALPRPEVEPHTERAEDHLGAVENGAPPAATQAPAAKAKSKDKAAKAELRTLLKPFLDELIAEFNREDHGVEIRQVAGGYRMSTKPEHHDIVRAFAKSLKPPIRLSLQALETLAVIAYKQPVTVPEISEIRGVDSSGVIGTLLERKLITTAGRKAVVGRPMLYKTTKDFLLRFGLRDITELPSLEEFEKLAAGELQEELLAARGAGVADATGVPDGEVEEGVQLGEGVEIGEGVQLGEGAPRAGSRLDDGGIEQMAEDKAELPQNVTEPTVSSDPRHNQTDEEIAGEVASESAGG